MYMALDILELVKEEHKYHVSFTTLFLLKGYSLR